MPRRKSPVEFISGNELLKRQSQPQPAQNQLLGTQAEVDALDRMIGRIQAARVFHGQKLMDGGYEPQPPAGQTQFDVNPALLRQQQEFDRFRSMPGGQQMIDRFSGQGLAAMDRGRSFLDSLRSGEMQYSAQREAARNTAPLTQQSATTDTTSGPAAVAARREAMRQQNGGLTSGELRRTQQRSATLQNQMAGGLLSGSQAGRQFDAFGARQGVSETDAFQQMSQQFLPPSRTNQAAQQPLIQQQQQRQLISDSISGNRKWPTADRVQAKTELAGETDANGQKVAAGIVDDPFLNSSTGIGVTESDSFISATEKLMSNWNDVAPEDLVPWANYFSRMQISSGNKWGATPKEDNTYGVPAMYQAMKNLAATVASGDQQAIEQAMAAARQHWLFYSQSRARRVKDNRKKTHWLDSYSGTSAAGMF